MSVDVHILWWKLYKWNVNYQWVQVICPYSIYSAELTIACSAGMHFGLAIGYIKKNTIRCTGYLSKLVQNLLLCKFPRVGEFPSQQSY